MRKYLTIFILFTACIEPYTLEILGTRKVLIIDAIVTNLPDENSVRLEYSYSLGKSEPEQVSGATVTVTDDMGNTEEFLQVSPGLYKPDDSFAGVVGRKYQLHVETPGGGLYQSLEEELLAPGTITDIYGEYLTFRSDSSSGFDKGIQFLADIDEVDVKSSNYRFQFEESYEIILPYGSLYEFNASAPSIDLRDPSISLCYTNESSQGLLIATTSGQVSSELKEFPIVFVSEEDPTLNGDYSLSIRSYRVSAEAYQYYKDLEENNESSGSFFDRQKGVLIGNILSTQNLTEPVLGYFEVAGVSVETKTFESGTWKEVGFSPGNRLAYCRTLLDTVQTADLLYGNIDLNDRLIFNFNVDSDEQVPGTFYPVEIILAPETCSDCRYYGTLEEPEL